MIHSIAISAALTFSAGRALLFLAKRVGWVDEPSAEDSERKLQAAPVPVVGGAAILVGLMALEIGGLDSLRPVLPVGHELDGSRIWLALVAAFLLGLVDDLIRGGLAPGVKVAGQVGVGLVVAHSVFALEPIATLACVLVVPLALNVWNTFDNADGAATGVGALALFSVGSPAAGPVLGFLGCNLRPRGSAAAYLGDSGSHLLGCLKTSVIKGTRRPSHDCCIHPILDREQCRHFVTISLDHACK